MSKAFQSSLPSSSSSFIQASPVPTLYSTSSSTSFPVTYTNRAPYTGGNGTWQAPAGWNIHAPNAQPSPKQPPKPKNRTPEEEEITKRTAARVAVRLALDHAAVINPDTETPFADSLDVVNRLLPYHVFLQPKEDLDPKGKRKANNLVTEIEETKFALECFKRKRRLEERFRRARTRSGKRPAPDDQAVSLAQVVLDADRSETAWLNSEIRAARADLDKIQREQREAKARLQPSAPVPQPQYYRAYPYNYTQQPYGQTGTFSVPPATTTSSANHPQFASNTTIPVQLSNTAVPVQLPVSSLPALHALGIQPVAATSLAPGAAQPPAVLRGSSADGTTLNLEINVSLLQAAQVNGLAIVLNSLMSRQYT